MNTHDVVAAAVAVWQPVWPGGGQPSRLYEDPAAARGAVTAVAAEFAGQAAGLLAWEREHDGPSPAAEQLFLDTQPTGYGIVPVTLIPVTPAAFAVGPRIPVRPAALDTILWEVERAQTGLADPRAAIDAIAAALVGDRDQPQCLACGCDEQAPCAGGCEWVTEGPVDLCSSCAVDDQCGTAGCGQDNADTTDLAGDRDRYGWISAAVHGTGSSPVWYCSPGCALAAIRTDGEQLARAELDAADLAAPSPVLASAVASLPSPDGPGRGSVTVSVAGQDRHLVLTGIRITNAAFGARRRLTGRLTADSPDVVDGWYRHLRVSTTAGDVHTAVEAYVTVRTAVTSSTAGTRFLAVEWDGPVLTPAGSGTGDAR